MSCEFYYARYTCPHHITAYLVQVVVYEAGFLREEPSADADDFVGKCSE